MTRSDVRTWVTISRSEEPGEAAPRRRSSPVTFSNAVQYPNGSETSGASAAPANITPSEPRKVSMSATKRLVVISDLHSGCRLGLCPSGGVPLDDGGMYLPSDLQLKLWSMWREFWDDFVPTVTGGKPWALVVNGDAIDGVHHGSTTQVSHNLLDQVRIARDCLEPVVARSAGYYHVRGTEAHAGKSGRLEEQLAESLGAVTSQQGQSARHELWKKVGTHLVHVAHHVESGVGSEAAGPYRELQSMFSESARWGRRPPDGIARSHRHRCIVTEIPTGRGAGASRGREPSSTAACVVTPGWQGRTPFTYKTTTGRVATPQFGGVVITSVGGRLVIHRRVWTVDRSPTE